MGNHLVKNSRKLLKFYETVEKKEGTYDQLSKPYLYEVKISLRTRLLYEIIKHFERKSRSLPFGRPNTSMVQFISLLTKKSWHTPFQLHGAAELSFQPGQSTK